MQSQYNTYDPYKSTALIANRMQLNNQVTKCNSFCAIFFYKKKQNEQNNKENTFLCPF